jgi:hypothetical protein
VRTGAASPDPLGGRMAGWIEADDIAALEIDPFCARVEPRNQ